MVDPEKLRAVAAKIASKDLHVSAKRVHEAADQLEQYRKTHDEALRVAAELDCMLANHAKSKTAYDKMQGLAERIRSLLAGGKDDG